ncbi:MAG: cyclomaltodextrinase N-terminal domain-containing protein, partial [Alistipes sp.]
MRRILLILLAVAMMPGLLSARKAPSPVQRVEPLSWWVGMNTPLQLMIYGDDHEGESKGRG